MDNKRTLRSEIEELRQGLKLEYDDLYLLIHSSDDDLEKDMKDSDFDPTISKKISKSECIARYRAKCKGRAIIAGNVQSFLRALLNKYTN